MRLRRIADFVLVMSIVAAGIKLANACSRVLWVRSGQPVLVGRSMDWFEPMHTNLWALPRGIKRSGLAGKNSLRWTSKYGSLVAVVYNFASADGINEKGLDANILWLAESDFGSRNENLPGLSLSLWAQYYLDNFATVNDAVEATRQTRLQLVPVTISSKEKITSTVHLSLADKTGDSAIIEYVGGKPIIYHGRNYTVMTNSPTFDKQLELAKQYQGLGGDKPLPGTSEAADRFVRASYYEKNLPEPANYREAVAGVLSVMRNVSAPFGTAEPGRPNISATIFRTLADLTNGVYFFESTSSPDIVWVNMEKLNFAAGGPVEKLDLVNHRDLVGNVTPMFRPAAPFESLAAGGGR
ncbi:MAG TPA: linear amide C-N hydrolase [Candidatus Binataceae bacterium]|jgi:choloylglycine hydrolase|nr:linear amide C-N hydrolase [Candidatus Binataceae bacterium]